MKSYASVIILFLVVFSSCQELERDTRGLESQGFKALIELLIHSELVKNLASFNDQNKKVESSAEIYRDQSLV